MRRVAMIVLTSAAVFATAGSSAAPAGPREKTFIAVADAYVQAPAHVRSLSGLVARAFPGAKKPGKPAATKKSGKPAATKPAPPPAKSAPVPASSRATKPAPTPAKPAPVPASPSPPKPEQDKSTDKGSDKDTDKDKDKDTDKDKDKDKEDNGSGHDGKALRVDAKPIRVSYLRFRIEGIVGGIRKATLRLHAESTSAIGFEVRTVASDSWNESKLTWLNAPPFSSTVVGSSGSLAKDRWIEVDVTRGVTEVGSVSFALVTRSVGEIKLASRETGKTAPQLVVQFGGSPPTAVDDAVQTNEDTALEITASTLTANDSDPDGDPLTVTAVSSSAGTHGTVSLSGGIVRYVPAPNYNGPASFGYTVSDGSATAGATVAVTVRPVNDEPVASDGAAATDEDVPVAVTMAATDADGEALTYEIVSGPTKGTLSAPTGNHVTYTPNANANGSDSFTFRARDASSQSNTATVSLNVRPVNDAPTAAGDGYTIDEDTTLSIPAPGILANDGDVDGDALSTTLETLPAHGTLTYGTDGSFTYQPNPNFSGADSFSYRAGDGLARSGIATVTITVKPVNDAPNVANRVVETDEDTPLAINLAGTDVDGDTLTFTTSQPSHGSYANGTYTPGLNYVGPDSFEYTANDGNGGTDTATVTITVKPVNDAPNVNDRAVETDEDTPLLINLAGTDVDGDTLTITTTQPSHGSFAGGTYTPGLNYVGPDSFEYTASDGNGGTDTATVTITVRPVNDPPVANDQSVATDEDTPVEITLVASDADGDALSYEIVAGPTRGTLSVVSGDKVTYTPNANANGPDSFTFRARDAESGSNVATVSIDVGAVNDAPLAVDDDAATDEGMPVEITLVAADADGDSLSYAIVAGPAHGSLGPVSGNKVTYTPAAGFDGLDEFTFEANDGSVDSNTATVRITVRNVNRAPVAVGADVSTDENTAKLILLEATDADGDALTRTIVDGPSHGTLGPVSVDGVVLYTPSAGYSGPDQFTFKANDSTADSNVATVRITVRNVNVAPVASDGSAATDEGEPVEVTLEATDADGDALSYAIVAGPAHGSLGPISGNKVTYTPAADFDGSDSFTFKANDGSVDSNMATVSITVRNVNRAPVASDVDVATDEGVAKEISLVANDADGDSLSYAIVAGPGHGSLGPVSGNKVTYTPAAGFDGPDSFTFKANDGTIDSNVAKVSITVRNVNVAPVASDGSAATDEGEPVEVTLAASDADGDSLTFAIVSGPANGTLGPVSGDKVTYTPAAGFDGPDSFTFKANDGTADSNVATVSITVVLNDPQPSFPIRAAFYYPWFPNAWTQGFFPFTKYTPTAGYYDSGSAAVIASHIAEMRYGNIDAGLASWWGQGHHTDGRIPALLAGAAGTPFRWALYHEQESQGNPTVAEIQSDLTYIRDRYGNDPSYLRVNGKFVVFVYGAPGETCEMADRWNAANTVGAYIVLKGFAGYRDPVTGCRNKADAWHQYAPAVATDRQPSYSYTISPGFHLATEAGPQLGRDPARWRQNIRDMIASGEPWQLVTTFNEWGEGTSVEAARQWPSGTGHGDYLDALHNDGAEPGSSDPVLLAAGDIATCSATGDESTATLLGLQPEAKVATLGDNAYENGSTEDYNNCYDPTWGAAKARTFPSVGNHEYKTPGASGYFGYFGGAAGDPAKGYYSFDLGAWHVIVVNSNCSETGIGCSAGAEQEQWVREDMAAHPARCTLAYWHHPRFSSGTTHGSTPAMQPIWQALYEGGADLVLEGHEHNYERFGPLTAGGLQDSEHGIRSIVVGTGGRNNDYPFGLALPASDVQQSNVLGVVELTLHGDSWDWVFLPVGGQSFTDSGSATCNEGGGSPPPLVDSTPPNPPTGVTAAAIGPNRVDVEWLPAADDFGVARYRIFRDGTQVGIRTSTAFSDTTVSGGTTYRYTIVAEDAAGNQSAHSEPAEVTTPRAPGATLTFAPTDDTFVRKDRETVNLGTEPLLAIDGANSLLDPFFMKQALLKFDVSGIAGRPVLRAILRLNALDGSTSGGDFFRTADAGWLETSVTWATAPLTVGAAFASLGAVVAGTAVDVDVTSLVTGDGIISIRVTSTSANGVDYASKENPDPALAPQLLVEVE